MLFYQGDGIDHSGFATVPVGPFRVLDAAQDDLVSAICDRWTNSDKTRPLSVYALHVGGLNHRHDNEFVQAMSRADIVYADGSSVVGLARLAGAQRVGRASTTDVGWMLFRELGLRLGRTVRIALIGGPPSLAERAGEVFEAAGVAVVPMAEHGFHQDWSLVTSRLQEIAPDVCVIGMGAPREMLWVDRELGQLPPSIVLTCGGWFGFVTGDERRAPSALRRAGLEWVSRVAQAPRRLGMRYLLGAGTCLKLIPAALRYRKKWM